MFVCVQDKMPRMLEIFREEVADQPAANAPGTHKHRHTHTHTQRERERDGCTHHHGAVCVCGGGFMGAVNVFHIAFGEPPLLEEESAEEQAYVKDMQDFIKTQKAQLDALQVRIVNLLVPQVTH